MNKKTIAAIVVGIVLTVVLTIQALTWNPKVGECFWYQNEIYEITEIGEFDLKAQSEIHTLRVNIKALKEAHFKEAILRADCPVSVKK